MNLNKVMLMGHLGADPVQRFTRNGYPVVHFSLATSRRRKSASEASNTVTEEAADTWTEETQWHNIVVWGREGETCAQQLRRGHGVYVEGEIRTHKYEAKDKTQRMAFEIHADRVTFLTRPRAEAEATAELQASEELWVDAYAD